MPDAPTAAAVVDLDGVVSGWSDGGRSLLGWTTGQVVGRPVTDLVVDPRPASPGGAVPAPIHLDLSPFATGTVSRWTRW